MTEENKLSPADLLKKVHDHIKNGRPSFFAGTLTRNGYIGRLLDKCNELEALSNNNLDVKAILIELRTLLNQAQKDYFALSNANTVPDEAASIQESLKKGSIETIREKFNLLIDALEKARKSSKQPADPAQINLAATMFNSAHYKTVIDLALNDFNKQIDHTLRHKHPSLR